jgi:membrane carboxypeptidase/penicillin-binding protein PbpC
VTGAGPIFHDVMLAAVERVRGALPIEDPRPIALPTPDVRRVELCAVSGLAPGAACLSRVTEWLPPEAHPARCTWHRGTGFGVETVWPDAYRHWARDQGFDVAGTPAAIDTPLRARSRATPDEGFRVVAPLAGALYLIDPTRRPELQSLPLRAAGAAAGDLEWFVDGTSGGTVASVGPLRWPLARGAHEIRVRDASGRTAETRVVVR